MGIIQAASNESCRQPRKLRFSVVAHISCEPQKRTSWQKWSSPVHFSDRLCKSPFFSQRHFTKKCVKSKVQFQEATTEN
ncbi:hypothetical protein PFLUV_G00153260 [Perca fluviatilis]|uniref:Uncharacterized protein n=1 Tax=Perca fluviatilis TaxID=8168 RepID=A0A6A5EYU5_PERFL|nr:hypothetical protein PFLUV_G00153260 [Perca fluviatilis]